MLLLLPEFGVVTLELQQLAVAAAFDDFALLHNKDGVGVADGGEAVGDDEGGALAADFVERIQDHLLGDGVQ